MRKIIILLLILRGVNSAQAQCIEGNCNNGFGTAIFKKQYGVKYTGYFKGKRPHGKGVAEYPNGRIYDGEWQAGMWHGKGFLLLTDGSKLGDSWAFGRLKSDNDVDLVTTSDPDIQEQQINTNNTAITPRKTQGSTNSFSVETVSSQALPEIWALAVGVASYENAEIPSLKYPDNDAFNMYAFWKSPMGGSLDDSHSLVLVDDGATKAMINHAMRSVYSKAKEEDLAIFFFSGHGLKGSFLPNDYDGDNIRLYHNEVSKILSECKAKHKLVIADACHSGSYIASKGVKSKPTKQADASDFYKEIAKSDGGIAFLLSSQADEESLEVSSLRNSVFTYFVVRGLKGEANANGDTFITIQELFDYVYLNVTSYASQLGKVQTPLIKGQYDPNMPVAIVKN
jgi:hypothetical protein